LRRPRRRAGRGCRRTGRAARRPAPPGHARVRPHGRAPHGLRESGSPYPPLRQRARTARLCRGGEPGRGRRAPRSGAGPAARRAGL
ncbi:MAG: Phosphomannomutase, partial [uncultured Rubellimicrobium sp.]